jgi:hypothetical protein
MRRTITLFLSACFFATALAGCELVADFDRGKLPMPKIDAGIKPLRDAGSAEPDEDAGSADAGTRADAASPD